MSKMHRRFVAGALAATCLAAAGLALAQSADESNAALTPVYQERMKQASPAIKEQIEKLREEGRKKGWTFQVAYTKAMEGPLEKRTGLRIPPDAKARAIKQTKFAVEAIAADDEAAAEAGVKPDKPVCSASQKAFDWAAQGKVTAVKDQGECGSCWAFAAAGAFEASWRIRNNAQIDTAEQQFIDCAVDQDGNDTGSCGGGISDYVFHWLISHGGGREVSQRYTGKDGACNASMASPYRAVAWGFATPDGERPSVKELKEAICNHGPVTAAVITTPAFGAYAGGTFNEGVSGTGNHSIVLTGWDDARQAFHLKNSWGTEWGENGYMWIRYDTNRVGEWATWVRPANKLYVSSRLPALVRKYGLADDVKPFETPPAP